MKKVYIKPEIFFESFAASSAIAGDCEREVGHPTKGACGVPDATGEFFLFTDTSTGCNIPMGEVDVHDGFCYHVPTESFTLFNS